jgi:hypothetical protein
VTPTAYTDNLTGSYRNPAGRLVSTEQLTANPEDPNPLRICTGPAPGHGWYAGRVQT